MRVTINNIPRDLKTVIDSEPVDFLIKSAKNHPRKNGMSLSIFSLFWNTIVMVLLIGFIKPSFENGKLHLASDDLDSLLFPAIFLGFFLVIGIAIGVWGAIMLFQKGGYFVGTESRLIKYRKGTVEIKDWEQFSGNIKVKKRKTHGDLELELRTGKMRSRKNGGDQFVPDIIFISKIENVLEVEKKCRIRIKENDPTPRVDH